jgi:predicted DNA-binding transcriptional regulator AlpA
MKKKALDHEVFELLSMAEVADLLRCSVRQVQRLAAVGRIPKPIAIGGLRRWQGRELRESLLEGCRSAQEEMGDEA